MFLKNSLASDFITRPTRGLAWASAEDGASGEAASNAHTAASAVARRVRGKRVMSDVSSFDGCKQRDRQGGKAGILDPRERLRERFRFPAQQPRRATWGKHAGRGPG